MRDLAVLFLHLLATVAGLAGPGGARSVVAESVLVKHQLLILNRSRKRSPNLRSSDRVVAGLCAVFIRPGRLIRSAIVIRPSTLLRLHRSAGPSWLSVLGHAKDSLWSVDLFRCESAVLHTYWVLVVMDHWTRRIVGFGVRRGVVDGVALCRMFNHAKRGQSLPTYLSADHDPLYRFHQWQANLRILDIREIKTVPYVPCSHPVVERLIGTVRRECLDRLLFWTAADLERKLVDFQQYYNKHRTHAGRAGRPPAPSPGPVGAQARLRAYRWQPHCRGLYHTPRAA